MVGVADDSILRQVMCILWLLITVCYFFSEYTRMATREVADKQIRQS
jgi:hypothetical protein